MQFKCLNTSFFSVAGSEDLVDDVEHLGNCVRLKFPRVRHRDICAGKTTHGSIKVVEGVGLHDAGCDLRSNTALGPALFNIYYTVSLFY